MHACCLANRSWSLSSLKRAIAYDLHFSYLCPKIQILVSFSQSEEKKKVIIVLKNTCPKTLLTNFDIIGLTNLVIRHFLEIIHIVKKLYSPLKNET